jgi:hypothetical protein
MLQAPLVEHDEDCVNNKELQNDPKIWRGALRALCVVCSPNGEMHAQLCLSHRS